ncbi:MAG TPA: PIG-L family deacetylase [Pseudomonadota bacterium]|nr:PIG-L family deacetylase [Pseudomonadota bacterium]
MSERQVIAAIYAHPDDGEFFAAGTLAKWAQAGHTVYAICATNGDIGSKRRDVSQAQLAEQRAKELGLALSTFGGQPPIMLGFPDGHLAEHAAALRERLIYFLRKLAVDKVVTFDPWKRYEIHPDHITAGKMASEAAVFSCFPLLHPEHLVDGVTARQPQEVWYMMPTEHKPNRLVDISTTFDTKVRSLLCHSSQIEMLADWFVKGADPTQLTNAQRAELTAGARNFLQMMAQGVAMLKKEVPLAEAFFVQPVGPGHFQNYQQMFQETLGVPPEDPSVE